MNTARREFVHGMRDTIPMIVGAIPFGVLFGALAITAGLSVTATLALSLLVFAGSAQFIAATLVASGTPVSVIAVTTFVVNLRHALYAASLGPYLRHLSLRWLVPLAHWMTDETYAVVIQRFEKHPDDGNKHWYYAGSGLFMYLNWQFCTLVGIVAGQRLSGMREWGLEFAMVVTFIGIVVPMLKSRPMLSSAIVSGAVALMAHDLPHQAGLLVAAVVGIATGYMLESMQVVAEPDAPADGVRSEVDRG